MLGHSGTRRVLGRQRKAQDPNSPPLTLHHHTAPLSTCEDTSLPGNAAMFPPLSAGAHPQHVWPLLVLLGKRRHSGKARVNTQEPEAITLVGAIEKPQGMQHGHSEELSPPYEGSGARSHTEGLNRPPQPERSIPPTSPTAVFREKNGRGAHKID